MVIVLLSTTDTEWGVDVTSASPESRVCVRPWTEHMVDVSLASLANSVTRVQIFANWRASEIRAPPLLAIVLANEDSIVRKLLSDMK
jgi:hypothetical protein